MARQTGKMRKSWESFKNNTGIHGFAEYSDLGHVAKAAWIVLVVVVFGFCVVQLVALCATYAKGEGVTTIGMANDAKIPDIRIIFGAAHAWNYKGWVQDEESLMKRAMDPANATTETAYTSGCPFPETTAWDGYNSRYAGYMGVKGKAVTDYAWQKLRVDPRDLIKYVVLVKRGSQPHYLGKDSFVPLLGPHGPGLLIGMSNRRKTEVDSISVFFDESILLFNHTLYFAVGTASKKIDYNPRDALSVGYCGTLGHVIIAKLIGFTREGDMCSKYLTESKLGCISECQIQSASTYGCTPWFGEGAPETVVCPPEAYEDCYSTYKRCVKYCEECTVCGMCEEVVAELTELYDDHVHDNEVRLVFQTGKVITYHTKHLYTAVAFLSQVGGILGLCFGISIVSIGHLVCFMGSLVKASVSCKADVEEEPRTEEDE